MKKELSIKELCNIQYKDKKLVIPIGYANKKKLLYINLKNTSGIFIAGATGTGKSIFIDDLIVSLIYKNSPSDVNFIMLDPKKIELGEYNGINYLIGGKSYSNKSGYDVLLKLLKLLDFRVRVLMKTKRRNIGGYNRVNKEKWPHIFIVVDEASNIIKMPDSYAVFNKILEFGECVGVHLIYATNAYLKDYSDSKFIDKFKYRISFDLSSEEQAKFIDIDNANWLKESGEALLKSPDGKIYKFKAPYVKDDEIIEVVLSNMGGNYDKK